jgi:putative membrane protein
MLDFGRVSMIVLLAGSLSLAAAAQQNAGAAGQDSRKPSAAAQDSSTLSAADQKFVKEAAQGGLAEVELGQLATEKGSSDEVKKFGQRMVDDHGKANDELKQVASAKGIQLPTELNAKDKATKERLSKLSGDQFDKAYMADMVRDHKKDVAAFRRESKMAKDSDLKNFAAETLPTLEDHLKQAQSIAPKGASKGGGSAQTPKPSPKKSGVGIENNGSNASSEIRTLKSR